MGTTPALRLSVVVPVHDGAAYLGRSLAALRASDLPRESWELIVVDDASRDGSGAVAAKHADRVLRIENGPRGAAFGRNHGVEVSRGDVIAFVDGDVIVHRDALRRMLEVLDSDASVAAVFGAYDEAPEAAGFISQYRNLLHRYVHLKGAGDADTFWTGCGAVRRAAFEEAGGFDDVAFRWHIEDIDLGYRIRDRGWRILLRPDIQGTHLKRWTLPGMIRTDVLDRGVPWMRLMLRRRSKQAEHRMPGSDSTSQVIASGRSRGTRSGTLNIRWPEKVKTGLVTAALLLGVAALTSGQARWVWAASLALTITVLANVPLYSWFAQRRGVGFAIGVVPMSLLYYVLNAACAATALALHVRDRLSARSTARLGI